MHSQSAQQRILQEHVTRVASGEGSSARGVDRKELDTTEKDKWLELAKKLNAEKKMLEDDDEEEDAALSVGLATAKKRKVDKERIARACDNKADAMLNHGVRVNPRLKEMYGNKKQKRMIKETDESD